jgi:hypothetical protein
MEASCLVNEKKGKMLAKLVGLGENDSTCIPGSLRVRTIALAVTMSLRAVQHLPPVRYNSFHRALSMFTIFFSLY